MSQTKASVWARRAPSAVKTKPKSKPDFSPLKAEEALVEMPVDLTKLSQLAQALVEAGAFNGESLKLMIFGTTKTDHKQLHSDINVNGEKFTATAYLPFMKSDQSVEEYVEGVADLLCESASRVQGTITGVISGLGQVQLEKPVKTL